MVALSAGTAALHLGLIELGAQAGDEVICQSFTFAASANPIAYQSATPVYVDSEQDTWNMSPLFWKKRSKTACVKPENYRKLLSRFIYMACLQNG